MSYDAINERLHDLGWSPFARPAPEPVATALAGGMTVDEVVSRLDGVVVALVESHFYPTIRQASYSKFVERGHFWVLDTAIALGLQHEEPVPNIGRALTVSEWRSHLEKGYTRQGFRDDNCGPNSEQGKLRREAARVPPAEFSGYEQIWELAVLSGSIPVGLTGFDPAYAQKSPRLSDIRGLDAQKWLENLTHLDIHPGDAEHMPWPPQKPVKK